MPCDVLAVGTELLLGQIIDSNSAWMGEQLALHGIDSLVQVKVGDNVARIVVQLERLLAEADAVIVCGGLGPTHDDLTREAIAAVMGVELQLVETVADVIRQMYTPAGSPAPSSTPSSISTWRLLSTLPGSNVPWRMKSATKRLAG